MEQYIPKSALVAKIEKLFEKAGNSLGEYRNGAEHTLISIKDFLDTLEVKEVDFEKEYAKYSNDIDAEYAFPIDLADFKDFARHFFELGLKVSNHLTWKDIAHINDIISEILKECKDKILYDTQESFCKEVLKRFKVQKGEEV